MDFLQYISACLKTPVCRAIISMNMTTKQIVLITGANRGIGYGVARKLAREYPDYHVIVGSRDASQGREAVTSLLAAAAAAEEKGGGGGGGGGLSASSLSSMQIDVTSDTSIAAAKTAVEQQYGRLDVLINNAGIALDTKEKDTLSLREIMQRTYEVNVVGSAVVTDAFIPLLEKSTNPRIVFVSSITGSLHNATPQSGVPYYRMPYLAYRSSKTALNMVMLHYNGWLHEKGFKVNAACPGHIGTNLNSFQGAGTLEEGAVNIVRLAVLGKDGETGTFTSKEGEIPW